MVLVELAVALLLRPVMELQVVVVLQVPLAPGHSHEAAVAVGLEPLLLEVVVLLLAQSMVTPRVPLPTLLEAVLDRFLLATLLAEEA